MKRRLIAYPIVFFVLYFVFMTAMTFKIFKPVMPPSPDLNFFDEKNSEHLFLKTNDNIEISAVYAPRGKRDKAFICLHGFGTGKYDIEDAALEFYLKGYSVLLVSFRGHDDSQNAYVTLGGNEVLDVKAGYDFLREKGYDKIYGWGVSMGASSLVRAAARDDIDFNAVIAESPFYSFEKVVKRYGRLFFGFSPWMHYTAVSNIYRIISGVNPKDIDLGKAALKINKTQTPVLVFAAEKDIQVPAAEVKDFYDVLDTKKKYILVEDAVHVECRFKDEDYFEKIFGFIAE